jgi:hypothetical protein
VIERDRDSRVLRFKQCDHVSANGVDRCESHLEFPEDDIVTQALKPDRKMR